MYISRRLDAVAGLVFACLLAVSPCRAGEETGPPVDAATTPTSHVDEQAKHPKGDLAIGLTAVAAALAVGLSAVATGFAQSRIGSAGCGTLAEKPDAAGTIILLVAIPETMVILGFVVAIVLLFGA